MSNRTVIGIVALALLMFQWSPVSFADRQDPDMADRIYEKFKEREQNKRDEKRTPGSSDRRETSRSDNRRNDSERNQAQPAQSPPNQDSNRSNDQRKSRETTRETSRESRERTDNNARSESREPRSGRTSETRSSGTRTYDRQEPGSVQAGEQLSRELRNLMNRKSQQQRSEPPARNSYSGDSQRRAPGGTDEREVREQVSLDQAVNIVRRQSNGKVISARSEGSGASRKHRIKVLIDDRRVRTYVVSAITGKVY